MFAEAEIGMDDFLGGRMQLWQPKRGYRAATDPVLLAAAVDAKAGETVLDLGCGAGAAGLCLACRVPGLALAGLELQPAYAELARRNAACNGTDFEVHEGDLTQMPAGLRRGFDHVMANPPYYAAEGSASPDPGRDLAVRVQDVPVSVWVAAAARRLVPGGWLTLIFATPMLPHALSAMNGCGSAVVLPLAAREGRAAKRVILRARKGGRGAFRLLAPMLLHEGSVHPGDREAYSAEATAILRGGASLKNNFR